MIVSSSHKMTHFSPHSLHWPTPIIQRELPGLCPIVSRRIFTRPEKGMAKAKVRHTFSHAYIVKVRNLLMPATAKKKTTMMMMTEEKPYHNFWSETAQNQLWWWGGGKRALLSLALPPLVFKSKFNRPNMSMAQSPPFVVPHFSVLYWFMTTG